MNTHIYIYIFISYIYGTGPFMSILFSHKKNRVRNGKNCIMRPGLVQPAGPGQPKARRAQAGPAQLSWLRLPAWPAGPAARPGLARLALPGQPNAACCNLAGLAPPGRSDQPAPPSWPGRPGPERKKFGSLLFFNYNPARPGPGTERKEL